jgi:hypothetical protein
MIRDPSDGSVREKPVLETATSGLPINRSKAEYLARLEKSRDWLKQYFEPKA